MFKGNTTWTSVTFLSTVTTIDNASPIISVGYERFSSCISLTTLTLGELTGLGICAFSGRKVLPREKIKLADSLITIPADAFNGYSLYYLT